MQRVFSYLVLLLFLASSAVAEEHYDARENLNHEVLKEVLKKRLVLLMNPETENCREEIEEKLKALPAPAVPSVFYDFAGYLVQHLGKTDSPLGRLINKFNLELKTLESDEEEGGNVPAVGYDYRKVKCKELVDNKNSRLSGLNATLASRGTIALKSIENSKDFLDANLSLGYFSSWGGEVKKDGPEFESVVNRFMEKLNKNKDRSISFTSKEWRDFREQVGPLLSNQLYLNIAVATGIESDQKFKTKHLTLGLEGTVLPRTWNRDSFLGKANIFDYVPAVIRRLTGRDSELSLYGSAFPTINTGLKHVWPQDDDPRFEAGDKSNFWRYEVEINCSSPLFRLGGNDVSWENNFRYYAEINPDEMVKQSGQDDYAYFVTAVKMKNGPFLSYSRGKLPFDEKDDQIYELGFSYEF